MTVCNRCPSTQCSLSGHISDQIPTNLLSRTTRWWFWSNVSWHTTWDHWLMCVCQWIVDFELIAYIIRYKATVSIESGLSPHSFDDNRWTLLEGLASLSFLNENGPNSEFNHPSLTESNVAKLEGGMSPTLSGRSYYNQKSHSSSSPLSPDRKSVV